MTDKLKNAFDDIRADEKLKEDTMTFLQDKMRRAERKKKSLKLKRLAASIACLLVVAFTGIFSYNVYFTETMFVDVDINPSAQLTVNRFGRVIGVYAYNEDAESLLSQLTLVHKPYDIAVNMLTEAALQNNFLSDGGLVSVTLQADETEGDDAFLKTLQANIASATQEHHASVQIDVFSVDSETCAHARNLNMTPAKYLAILELQQVDPTATIDECRNHTIGEIRESTARHGGRHHGKNGHRCNGHH